MAEKKSHCRVKKSFVIINERGLHTRPSAELVKCAASFKSTIHLIHQDLTINAKSLLGVLMLAAARGTRLTIEAIGEDSKEAVNTILALARNKFNISY